MDFLLLGPVEARERGRTLPLGGAKQRALLALLLLHAGEVVSSDRLLEELWAECRPGRPEGAVRGDRAPAEDARRRPPPASPGAPGYALRIGDDELDLLRFERLAAEGRAASDPATAAARLHEALALWRGPPLADLAYEAAFQAEIARLEELRLAALEDRVDADLALGRHAAARRRARGARRRQPLRERLRGQLMLALYRSGRQAEALDAYRAGRAALVGELGIEPGRRLRDLHEAMLRQDPALELAAPAAPAVRSSGRPFVGRVHELAVLHEALEEAVAGRGGLVLIAGEPGIGKSRLADALAERARAAGARVLVGRCWEAGGAPAYWPWAQALREYLHGTDAATLAAHAGAGAADLAQMLPELRERLSGLPPPSTLEPELARFRLFDAAAELLRNAAAERPIVLVLDDLHAADPPSLLLLRFVARTLATARLLVVCAFRDVAPDPAPEVAEALAEVAREPGTRRIALRGLTGPEVAEYLALAAPEPVDPEVAEAVHERTEGNPLFVGELARLLALDGATGTGVPRGIREAIDRRLARLDEPSRRLLGLAAVLGREFRLDVLAALGDVPDDALLAWLDGVVAAGVVAESPGTPGRVRFEHVLFRDALYEGLSAARRVRLHGRVMSVLDGFGDDPAGLAAHALAAGDPAAHRHARAAADHALRRARVRRGRAAVRHRAGRPRAAPARRSGGALRAPAGGRRGARQRRRHRGGARAVPGRRGARPHRAPARGSGPRRARLRRAHRMAARRGRRPPRAAARGGARAGGLRGAPRAGCSRAWPGRGGTSRRSTPGPRSAARPSRSRARSAIPSCWRRS